MHLMSTMIKCLPKEVQGKLRSGVAIPSLQQCVEELILNSIDAEATCVGVRVDMEAFKVQVIDNGAGMNAGDMECVGNRYYTSKCSSVEDLDDLRWYGFRGEALASVVSLATLVEISSRTRSSVKTHVKIFKDGKGMDVFEAEAARPSAGTTVVICNFFHNMPVRRKRMDAVLERERIRHRVEAISLMHPSVSFTLKNDCTGAMMVQLPKANNTYHRFVQIHSLGRAQKLGEISHMHGQFEVIGYIGKEGHYNNSLQFLYVNDRLLLKTRIHKLLNFLLRRLSSSHQRNDSPERQSAIRSPKHKWSQDLHGVYVINIKCSYSEYDICLEPAKTLIEFKDWDGILLCIEEAVKAFLSRENLVAVLSQDYLDDVSPQLFCNDNTDQDCHDSGNGDQANSSAPTLDYSIGMKLASHSVHRKCKDDTVCETSVCQESELTETEQIDELEKMKSINKECGEKPACHLARLEPASDNNITEKGGPTFSEAEEGSQIVYTSNSIKQLATEKLELLTEIETRLNVTTSTSNETSQDGTTQEIQPDLNCIEHVLTDFKGSEGNKQNLVINRKIRLSEPYIHENLQTQDSFQFNKSVSQGENSAHKCEERSFASKRKISLDAAKDITGQKLFKDLAPMIPSKIPRIVTYPKLSLCKESGSLEKFRRVYGKSEELKLPSKEARQVINTRPAQADSLQSPPTLSVFTNMKPMSVQNRGKKSLAAKLCLLKQHRPDNSKVLPHLSRTSSQDNTCLTGVSDSIQKSNKNEDPCDTPLNPEPVLLCRTEPQVAEREEVTASGDWIHHYDTSVGKTVYVNKVTGLSRYEDLPTEETQVRCTSDVTNMAVSVISEMGEIAFFLCLF